MEKLKNLCGQIPEELHNKVRTEQESLGLTLGKYLEQVLTAHFAAPAPAVRGGDRTLAFQVPEVLFQRVKQYQQMQAPFFRYSYRFICGSCPWLCSKRSARSGTVYSIFVLEVCRALSWPSSGSGPSSSR